MSFLWGILLGVILLAAVLVLRYYRVMIRWYEWLLAGIGFLLVIFAWQNFVATRAEHWNPDTPLTFLFTFGIPGLLLIGIAKGLVIWRWYRARKTKVA